MCYSSNASFRTNSNTAACIVSLIYFWQKGGAIYNASWFGPGNISISASEFIDNIANDVSDALCAT